jgi:uncharacterized protein
MNKLILIIALVCVCSFSPSYAQEGPRFDCHECDEIYPDIGKTEFTYRKGSLHGLQKVYYKNGKVFQELNYKNGLLQGPQTTYHKDGSIWDKQTYRSGLLMEGNYLKNGWLRRHYKNGQLAMEAEYKDGRPIGEIKSYYENGKIKTIEKIMDYEHSSLTTYNELGQVKFEGNYVKGAYNGRLILRYDTGKLHYEMEVNNGVPHGTRRDYAPNGTLTGEFHYIDGYNKWHYIAYDTQGRILSSGTYSGKEVVKSLGPIQVYHPNGKLRQKGTWDGSKWVDTMQEFDENGILKIETIFKKDSSEKTIKKYYPTGELKEEGLSNGRDWIGTYKYYYKNGALWLETPYQNGRMHGKRKLYYDSGELQREQNFVKGIEDGRIATYYKNGKLKSEGRVKDGKNLGSHKTYYDNGKLRSEVRYNEKGQPSGKFYDINGNPAESLPELGAQ